MHNGVLRLFTCLLLPFRGTAPRPRWRGLNEPSQSSLAPSRDAIPLQVHTSGICFIIVSLLIDYDDLRRKHDFTLKSGSGNSRWRPVSRPTPILLRTGGWVLDHPCSSFRSCPTVTELRRAMICRSRTAIGVMARVRSENSLRPTPIRAPW